MSSFSIKACGPFTKRPTQQANSESGEFSYLFDEKTQQATDPLSTGPKPTDPKHGGHCIHVSTTPTPSTGPNPNHPKHGGHCIHSSGTGLPDAH